ncbi:DUF2975 domain-containing protein [Desulfovibrio sp. TomC]|uniref:DUF2975 domain-containing protein n=1 Tax=Desulfovibrio sp. TomC TaxID=1562888 RepID=UPI0005733781|nr:DUF2975 domain-containing protein [Desulfovibrio sp. TomC]KHK04565.1 hypothetical protein NY78_0346 [Desulfovibrio sp. TomC]
METVNNLDNIRRQGWLLETASLAAALSVVPLTALYWAFFNSLPDDMTRQAAALAVQPELPGWVRLLCFVAAMVPGAALLVVLLRLRRLFALYKEGSIFSLANVLAFRSVARALLAWAVCSILFTPLFSLAVTAANPPGRHMISLGVGSTEVVLVFLAILALVIGRVMDEARRLDEDAALTV